MGQNKSKEYSPIEAKAEPAIPTFLDVNRERADRAQAEINAILDAELTEEKLSQSVIQVADWIIAKIVSGSAAGSTNLYGDGIIPLFAETWRKLRPFLLPGASDEPNFHERMKKHLARIAKEVSARTGLVSKIYDLYIIEKTPAFSLRMGDAGRIEYAIKY